MTQKLVMWLQTIASASNIAVNMQADRTKCLVTARAQVGLLVHLGPELL